MIKPKRRGRRRDAATYFKIDTLVDSLMCRYVPKGTIKAIVAAEYGLSFRAVDRAIRRSKDRFLEDSRRPRSHHRAECVATLHHIIADTETDPPTKIKAIQTLAKLLGLNKPEIIRIQSGNNMDQLTETRQKLVNDPEASELLLKLAERAANLPHGGTIEIHPPTKHPRTLPPIEADRPAEPGVEPTGESVRRAFKRNGANGK
jgi:hypothetical protein